MHNGPIDLGSGVLFAPPYLTDIIYTMGGGEGGRSDSSGVRGQNQTYFVAREGGGGRGRKLSNGRFFFRLSDLGRSSREWSGFC